VEEVVNNGENMEPINHDDDFDDFEVGSSAKTIIAVFGLLLFRKIDRGYD